MYCTPGDIAGEMTEKNLAELTDDSAGSVVDNAVVQSRIDAATVEIDGYLRGQVALPIEFESLILKSIAIDLTVFKLYTRRFSGDLPDGIKARYDSAVKRLKDIQNGILLLEEQIVSVTTTGSSGIWSKSRSREKIYTDDLLNRM